MNTIIETGINKIVKKNATRKKSTLSLDFRSNLDPLLTISPAPINVDVAAEKPEEKKKAVEKKRCPQGTRKNRKTGECEAVKGVIDESGKEPTKEKDSPKKRCPQGTRKNRKTGECESIAPPPATTEVTKQPRKKQTIAAMPIPVNEPTDTVSNSELFAAEKREHTEQGREISTYDFLYPNLNDPRFNEKIAQHKEFADTQYDGTLYDVKKQAELMCNARFELMPHQIFVKNFMSLQTPYNSLLLYHGLGSGKTLSSIGIAEEMRAYMKQMNITQRIIVVASPNVQANYKLQLFDERKLRLVAGSENMGDAIWTMDNSIGNALLKEINPTNLKGLTREKIISSVRRIINQYYLFIGYGQLSNYIYSAIKKNPNYDTMPREQRKKIFVKYVREQFDNRLLIIDEVHNIRLADDNQERKKTALLLMQVAKHAQNMRMILLSATPLFNSYKEIIWLTNLMNINDKRATIEITDVFDADGYFKPADPAKGIEGGRELLMRKLTGYISYVRGENPYTFPYRIYPDTFAPEHIFAEENAYPQYQMNGNPVEEPIKHIKTYNTTLGIYQAKGYAKIIEDMKEKSYEQYTTSGEVRRMPTFENMESFGYTVLQNPLQALNMVYPSTDEDSVIENMVGKSGLESVMKYVEEIQGGIPTRHSFEYKADILNDYKEIFSENELPKYSAKIAEICSIIKKSTGIVAIYSQYIDGGMVPIALALESMGFGRYCHSATAKNLFKTAPTSAIDALTMKTKTELGGANESWHPAKYAMITGDKALSPSNAADIKYITSTDNIHGEKVKVVLISKAGAEGLDFKNIRQIHVLEPWYNMNRIEQIIGRAVRTQSHCALPFEERNVEIYLHGSILPDQEIEAADLYVYRLAEKKAQQIGNVTRLLKTISVDCILNHGQTNFTEENLDTTVKLRLSTNNQTVDYAIGDKPHTEICDYMDNCNFTCANSPNSPNVLYNEYYNTHYVESNQEILLARIRELFREKTPKTQPAVSHVFYEREQLIARINAVKQYPLEQIFSALTRLIHNRDEYLVDAYGRTGRLVDKYDAATDTAYYVFQPIEITDENASIYDRSVPIEYKRSSITLEIDQVKDVAAPAVAAIEPEAVKVHTEVDHESYENLIHMLNIAISDTFSTQVLNKGEKNWYKHAGMIVYYSHPEHKYKEIQKIKNPDKTITTKTIEHSLPITQMRTEFKITDQQIRTYMVEHFIDVLSFGQKMTIVRHLYGHVASSRNSELEDLVKAYFDKRILQVGELMGISMMKDDTLVIMVKNAKDDTWSEADQEDYDVLGKGLLKWRIPRTSENMNDLLGFITLFVSKKSNVKEMVFKIKDMTEKRNNFGARIDDAGKDKVIKLLNKIATPDVLYDDANTQLITQLGLCIYIEILMRAFSDERRNGKYYYLQPEQTVMSEVIKKSFV